MGYEYLIYSEAESNKHLSPIKTLVVFYEL